MKLKPVVFISAAACAAVTVLFLVFRTTPSTQLWKGYRILYVSSSTLSSSDISAVIAESGCRNVVSSDVQQIPVTASESPVQAQSPDSYLFRRASFFTDKTGTDAVYYIPDNQARKINNAVNALNAKEGTSSGTDGSSRFPLLTPIIVTVLFAAALFLSSHKFVFTCSALFPLLFVWCNPFSTAAAAACFSFSGYFLIQRLWNRRNFLSAAVTSPLIILFLVSPVILLVPSSIRLAVFYTLSIAGSFACFILISSLQNYFKKNADFEPVSILGAQFYRRPGKTDVRLMEFCASAVLLILVFSLASSAFSVMQKKADDSHPMLPTPVRKTDSRDLPSNAEFSAWGWNTLTFPYRRLTDNHTMSDMPQEGDTVTVPVYAYEKDAIVQHEDEQFVYNGSFRRNLNRIVQNLPYPAIEKVMLKQGNSMQFAYTQNSGSQTERFSFIVLMLFIILPLATAAVCVSKYSLAGRKK